MRAEALASFMKTLQGANQLPPAQQPVEGVAEGGQGEEGNDDGDGKSTNTNADTDTAGGDTNYTENMAAGGVKVNIRDPLSPDRPSVGIAERFRLENNGVDSVGAGDMTIEMAEEWIADPLGGKSGVNHSIELGIGNNEAGVNRSPSSMLEQYGPGVDTTGQKLAKYGGNKMSLLF